MTAVPVDAWVFDAGPLRHFVAQQWTGVLRFLAGERPIYIPESVERELKNASEDIRGINDLLDAEWIQVYRSADLDYVQAFARYSNLLVAHGKNVGECGVLAMGEVYGCEMVIDDSTPRTIAEEAHLRVTSTVPLLCNAIRAKKLTMRMVESLADHLLEGEYFLPFEPGGFRQHVLENGLLDYEEVEPH